VDSSLNSAVTITRTINVIDTTPPSAPSISSPLSAELLTNNTPTLAGTGEANTTFEVRNGSGVLLGTGTVNGAGNYSFTPGTDLPQGTTTYSVNLVDASGNAGLVTSVTFTIDIEPPVVVMSAPTKLSNSAITDTTIVITDNF
jgi:hypothetical protein